MSRTPRTLGRGVHRAAKDGAPPPGDVYTETDPNLYNWDHREEVTIHGAVGHYYEEHNMYGIGAFRALVAWEYAPDSWAYVSTYSDRMDPGPERLRSTLIQVAQAVSPGAEPVRLPLRTDARPSSVPPLSKLARVSPTMGTGWETAVDFGHLRFTVGPGTVPRACEGCDGGVETFTYRGRPSRMPERIRHPCCEGAQCRELRPRCVLARARATYGARNDVGRRGWLACATVRRSTPTRMS